MRKAKRCTIEELKKEVSEFTPYEDEGKYSLICKDISKVSFDCENFSITNFPCDRYNGEDEGFYTINDLTFALYMAGGDWEIPVFFIAYLDPNNRVRGYIPKDGNTWNLQRKAASTEEDKDDECYEEREIDKTSFINDILRRIEVVNEGKLSSSNSTDD